MATTLEDSLAEAATTVLCSLRGGEGIPSADAEKLKALLATAAREWKDSPVIPKSAANLFVDLGSGIDACSYLYAPPEAEKVRLFGDDILRLVRLCVA